MGGLSQFCGAAAVVLCRQYVHTHAICVDLCGHGREIVIFEIVVQVSQKDRWPAAEFFTYAVSLR